MEPVSVVAYIANELRDEITLQRALAEVALADPTADTAALRKMGEKVIAASERQGRLLDALLTLAQCEYERLWAQPVSGAPRLSSDIAGCGCGSTLDAACAA